MGLKKSLESELIMLIYSVLNCVLIVFIYSVLNSVHCLKCSVTLGAKCCAAKHYRKNTFSS